MKISIIAALTDDGVIGKDGRIPWHISEDFRRFKALTMGHPVVMGRKTFESIIASLGKPLPGRTNIVITRNPNFRYEGALVFPRIQDAIDHCRQKGASQLFIIGGGEIYQQSMDLADEMHLTIVHQKVDGDTFFPKFNPAQWKEVWRETHQECSFVRLQKHA